LKRFVDLHLIPPLRDMNGIRRMAQLAAEMGLYLVGLTFDSGIPSEARLEPIEAFEGRGLETVSRVDLRPKHRNELLRSLREVRSSFDIVAVECRTRQVATVAFRDRRVDLVFFRPDRPKSMFGVSTPRSMRRLFEFNVADLLGSDSGIGSDLRRASDLLSYIQRRQLPIVISSGATNWWTMRAPKDMAAVVSVMGLEAEQAIDAVSRTSLTLARRSLEKRDPSYVSEGIRIVRSKA